MEAQLHTNTTSASMPCNCTRSPDSSEWTPSLASRAWGAAPAPSGVRGNAPGGVWGGSPAEAKNFHFRSKNQHSFMPIGIAACPYSCPNLNTEPYGGRRCTDTLRAVHIHIRTNEHRGIPNVRSVCVCAHRLQSCRRPHSPVSSRPITSICAHTPKRDTTPIHSQSTVSRMHERGSIAKGTHTRSRSLCALFLHV